MIREIPEQQGRLVRQDRVVLRDRVDLQDLRVQMAQMVERDLQDRQVLPDQVDRQALKVPQEQRVRQVVMVATAQQVLQDLKVTLLRLDPLRQEEIH